MVFNALGSSILIVENTSQYKNGILYSTNFSIETFTLHMISLRLDIFFFSHHQTKYIRKYVGLRTYQHPCIWTKRTCPSAISFTKNLTSVRLILNPNLCGEKPATEPWKGLVSLSCKLNEWGLWKDKRRLLQMLFWLYAWIDWWAGGD